MEEPWFQKVRNQSVDRLQVLKTVTIGAISVGDLTSLLLYTAYVGGSMGMLTYVCTFHTFTFHPDSSFNQLVLRECLLPCYQTRSLNAFKTSLMRGVGAGTRIFDLLERESLIEPEKGIRFDPTRRGTIKFDSVWFSYPTRQNVDILRGFTLDLGRGGSVALVYVLLLDCLTV